MFSGFQEREDYEDELYQEKSDSGLSDADSDLEFQLYSQLHYSNVDNQQEPDTPTQVDPKVPPPDPSNEVIVIESSTDNENESVCVNKGRVKKLRTQRNISPDDAIVVFDSDEIPDSDSVPFVADLFTDSDSDGLENWMILGQKTRREDQSIQLNFSEFTDQSTPELEIKDGPKWKVSDKDKWAQITNKVGVRRLPNRYYSEKSITCHNCKRSGHLSKNCPRPQKLSCCSLCGVQGHLARICPNRHCYNCLLPGHTSSQCVEKSSWHKRCHRCGMTGHFFDACPEIWRQFHLTTRPGPLIRSKDPEASRTPAYCFNCAKRGHFGHDCSAKRMYSGSFPTLPYVCYYDNTGDIKSREHRLKKKSKELQDANLISPARVVTPNSEPPWKKAKNNQKRFSSMQTTPKNTSRRFIDHTPKPHSAATPKKLKKKKKKKTKQIARKLIVDEDQDFPRSQTNDTRLQTTRTNNKIKTYFDKNARQKKKPKVQGNQVLMERSCPRDENLFGIFQKKKVKR